jgi:4-amino-4-deoxy-L-arabinose transferase-like glycosyltransferase
MLALSLALVAFTAEGWAPPKLLRKSSLQQCPASLHPSLSSSRSRTVVLRSTSSSTAVENGIALTGLTNVAEDAEYLAQAVQAQLDNEWIPQVIHQGLLRYFRKTRKGSV